MLVLSMMMTGTAGAPPLPQPPPPVTWPVVWVVAWAVVWEVIVSQQIAVTISNPFYVVFCPMLSLQEIFPKSDEKHGSSNF